MLAVRRYEVCPARRAYRGPEMANLQQMSRVLYHHCWNDIDDWVRSIDQLADLSDEEIGQLECCGEEPDRCSAGQGPAVTSAERPSLIERTRQSFAGLCDALRFGLRRTC